MAKPCDIEVEFRVTIEGYLIIRYSNTKGNEESDDFDNILGEFDHHRVPNPKEGKSDEETEDEDVNEEDGEDVDEEEDDEYEKDGDEENEEEGRCR